MIRLSMLIFVGVMFFRPLSAEGLAEEGYRDEQLGIVFPGMITPFVLVDSYTYPSPGLGYSLDYKTADPSTVTLYVYDFGVKGIPDGTDSEVVLSQLGQAIGDIQQADWSNKYQSIQPIQLNVELGQEFLHQCFIFEQGERADKISCVFMRGCREHFIKVRITGPARNLTEQLIKAYIEGLSGFLLEPEKVVNPSI